MQKNAGCKNGGPKDISRTKSARCYSLKDCSQACSNKRGGATMFQVYMEKDGLCEYIGGGQFLCVCVMKANPDTCEIVTQSDTDLYKINFETGNIIVSLHANLSNIDRILIYHDSSIL